MFGALLFGAVGAGPNEAKISAAPGTVVRWEAAGTERCESGGRSWLPHGDICYYPVDLGRTGELEIRRIRDGQLDRAVVSIGVYPYPVEHVTVEDRYVALSKADLERSQRERQRISALWSRTGEPRFALPLTAPLRDSPEARNFGARRVFNGEPRSPHSGADFSATTGTPVLATADGIVALAEEHFFGGNSVFLDHGDGLISMCMHLSEILVEADQEVRAGQVIGRVGSTGRVTGPHLHFGFRWRGARIDPAVLLGASSINAE